MKAPKHMAELMKIIFFWLGIAFVCGGILSLAGVLKPSAHSQAQDPIVLGKIFSAIGLIFVIAGTVCAVVTARIKKLYSELIETGIRLSGVVEKVYLQRNTQYGKRSPYRIVYSFTHMGKTYRHKSCLLWEKPDLNPGDSIKVYVNDSGKSTIVL